MEAPKFPISEDIISAYIIVECIEEASDPKIRSIPSCAFFDGYTEMSIEEQCASESSNSK
jgi:hypothetical protein